MMYDGCDPMHIVNDYRTWMRPINMKQATERLVQTLELMRPEDRETWLEGLVAMLDPLGRKLLAKVAEREE